MKEIRIWSRLTHKNILPFLGFILEGEYPSLISEWMDNGTASDYVREHPEDDILELVSRCFLTDEGRLKEIFR